jgi:tRNA-2-methylthio-N6-dimethylallyladenosine synthase
MVRDAIPDVAVTTDIIVGFPGETEDDFEQTLSLVAEARYDAAYTFQYSPRPMTPAADLPGQLSKPVVQERFERLNVLQEAISLERNQGRVGRVEEVIVEGPSKKDASRLTGRTRTNKVVHFGSDGATEGSFRSVAIIGAHPHHLDGELVSDGRAPLRGRALPLAEATACGSHR